jgi:hypothetical protein
MLSSLYSDRKNQILIKDSILSFFKPSISNNFSKIMYNYNDFLEVNRWVKRSQGNNTPLRLIKYPLSNKTDFNINENIIELFRFRFANNESTIKHKPVPHSTFLTMKQKRYKRRKSIPARVKFEKDLNGNNTKKIR